MLVESEQCSEVMFTLPRLLEEEFQMTRRASSLVRRHALCQGMRTSIIKRRKKSEQQVGIYSAAEAGEQRKEATHEVERLIPMPTMRSI